MRLCQIKQSYGKNYRTPDNNLVNATAAEIYQYSHRDPRSQSSITKFKTPN
ncbi:MULTISPECIES: hypothetical protein [Planktothricoides]|uniref:Uncharacterized protein n=2 Tax=Planktothricoides raciborskii TaxID=132608 RepID=A0AAU8JG20_9CYAN|nr:MULTISPECIES: hypothetical protein [Planktothricoides]MBD2545662.1 hypothetical protein [Planktothricoides raciborskii FACHB-1370]MBD2585278.1 hypothetical protein [Planktothricoides raciborskii FACHB-1261]